MATTNQVSSPEQAYRSHDPELATLLRQAQEINPAIDKVRVEIVFGEYDLVVFWAHTDDEAFRGRTPEALLADIRESSREGEAA